MSRSEQLQPTAYGTTSRHRRWPRVRNRSPRWLAGWGIGTYLSMLGLATIGLLLPDHPSWLEAVLYGAGTLFEVLVGLWLTIKGIDIERWKASAVSRQAS